MSDPATPSPLHKKSFWIIVAVVFCTLFAVFGVLWKQQAQQEQSALLLRQLELTQGLIEDIQQNGETDTARLGRWQSGALRLRQAGLCDWLVEELKREDLDLAIRQQAHLLHCLHERQADFSGLVLGVLILAGLSLYLLWRQRAACPLFPARDEAAARTAELFFVKSGYALALVDGEGLLQRANPAALSLFGKSEDEAEMGYLPELLPWPEHREEIQQALQRAVRGRLSRYQFNDEQKQEWIGIEFQPLDVSRGRSARQVLWQARYLSDAPLQPRYNQQEWWQQLFEKTDAILYIKGIDGRYLGINPAFEALFQRTAQNIIGSTDSALLPAYVSHALWLNDREVLTANRGITFEEHIPLDDSGNLTYLSLKSPIRSPQGDVIGLCGVSIDITKQRREMDKLYARLDSQQKKHLEILRQNNAELLMELTMRQRTEKLLAGEKQILEMLAAQHDLSGILEHLCYVLESLCPDGIALILLNPGNAETRERVIAPHAPRALLEQMQNISLDVYAELGDTSEENFQEQPVLFSPELGTSEPWRSWGFSVPANTGAHTEATMRAAYLVGLGTSQGQSLGLLAVFYRQWHKSSGNEQELIQRLSGVAGLAIEHKYNEVARNHAEMARSRALEALELERHSLSERVRDRTQALSTVNAQLRQALKAREDFLASMSHELRTPLNSILTVAQNMREGVYQELTEKQDDSMRVIAESGHHLLDLINDILDLAKIEAGKMSLELHRCDLQRVLDSSLRMVKPTMQKKLQQLETHIDPRLEWVQADERRLKQILVNLLSNAAKFTPDKGRIRVVMELQEAAETFTMQVEDSGIGIAQDDMAKLFKPFTQLDTGINRHYQGTGLGLSLVYRLTELHGGSVSVNSEPGQGSCFQVVLPWKPEAETVAPEIKDGPVIAEEPQENRAHILIAEDNAFNISSLRVYLQRHGYRVSLAYTGREVLERVAEERPDLILMDVDMPDMDGLEATRRLRADPAYQAIPVFAVTALAMPGDEERCIAVGMNRYFSKPLNLKNLLSSIEEQL